MRKSAEERFWAKVDKTPDCWNWVACKSPDGYGSFGLNRKVRGAHRVSYEWANGPIPDGAIIDHICHNPSCVRPSHLRLATQKQNVEYRKGPNRNNRGSGIRNVTRNGKGWQVIIRHHNVPHYFGTYPSSAEAEQVAIRERARLFTFPEDGKRAA